MPMDYDDNDTSRHNLQLAGEGRPRSSTLRPYDFPKFDFDNSLQGHLRFDTLVETEVFLGIQSQEDNQWIEDFSRGCNGMEFNSTPADSCSISRRNNVWSEATSSESVEMLLKSVGQEEMVPGASIIPESDATHDQGIASIQGEVGIKLKESNDAYVLNSDTVLQPGDVLEDSPASSSHMAGQLEDPSATHAKVESACGNSTNVNKNALSGNDVTSTNEGVNTYQDLCTGDKLENSQLPVQNTMDSGAVGDTLSLANETNNITPNIGILVTSKTSQQVEYNASLEGCSNDGQESQVSSITALEDTAIMEGKTGVRSISICTGSNSLGLVSESGTDCQEASHHFFQDSTNTSVKGESELKSSEGDDENTSTSIQTSRPVEVFSSCNDVNAPFDDQGRSQADLTQHSVQLGSLHSGHGASTEQDMDVTEQLSLNKDNEKKENVSAISLLSIDDSGASLITNDIGETDVNLSNVAVLSSATDNQHTEDVDGCHRDCVVTGEESAANVLSHGKDVSVHRSQEVHRQADLPESEKDICKTIEADKEVSTDLGNIESESAGTAKVDQRTKSPEIGEGVESNNPVHNLLTKISGELESANNIPPPATTSASTVNDCPEIGHKEPPTAGLYHLDNDRKENETKESNDAIIEAQVDSTAKAEERVATDTIGISYSEMASKSLQPVDKLDEGCCIEPSSSEAMNSLYSDQPQVHSDCNNKSSLKDDSEAHMVGGSNYEKAMSKEEEKDSAPNSESDKTSCGSPTIISSSEPSQMEKVNCEEGRGQVSDEVIKDIKSKSEDPKRKDLSVEDSSFTFKVNVLPDTSEKKAAKNWSPIPDVEKCQETAPSGKGKTERTTLQKTPRHNARVSDGESGLGSSKGTSERKGRRGSAKGTAKESSKKGNHMKGPIQENAPVKGDIVSNMLSSTPISSPLVQFGQMQSYGNIDASNKKATGAVAIPTSSLPDLNSSSLNNTTPSSASFRQPFTDMQQVQLRAQIFVYGSLIQGTAPDETCMNSAFGPSDGGYNWESVWRVAVERVRSQKSSSSVAETPSRSQSGPRASDGVKQGSYSSKVLATPLSRATNKDTPGTVVNPMIPLSSPLWNISTPTRDSLMSNAMHKGPIVDFQQSVAPVQSFQTPPPLKNFVGHTSWPPQTCFPAPWLASPQSASFSSSVRFNPVTMTETVKLTPVKDTLGGLTASAKHTTSSPVHNVSPIPVSRGLSPLQDSKIIVSADHHIVDSKPRKRKKVPASDPGQTSVSEAQTEAVVVSDVATFPSSSIGVLPLACQASDAILSKSYVEVSGVSSIEPPKKTDGDAGKAISCSEETLSKVAEAKSEAEIAADLATAAISHCEDLWSQMAKKKDSGLTSDAEVKLASAAVAIAAAASVAKAAAAAAKIACNAALQAKLMADEAFHSSQNIGMDPCNGKSSNGVHDIGNATPTSILKSNSVTSQSSSILLAAKEAAKKRVEAASAASRQAENLDAIVKAAELAAAAVSQAGKIVAMGEPLPLNDLIEAGPEGYWKSSQPSSVLVEKVKDGNAEQSGAVSLETDAGMLSSNPVKTSVEMGRSRTRTVGVDDIHSTEGLNGSLNVCISSSVGFMGSKHMDKMDFRSGINHNIPDESKSSKVASGSDALQSTTNFKNEHEVGTLAHEEFKEGSSVEVFKPGNGLKSAWYSANVLSLEDGKAYVCYNDLLSEEGSGNLREWVPLEGEGDKAPVIRAAHPSTALQYQQTRKRRRAALGDYAWCVGDRVDVWIDDCWWEGVVTEKNEKDETTLKVHIPAQEATSTVRAWNLRASLTWINGRWIECSSSGGQNASEQSDAPQEKRQKLEMPQSITKVKDKESNNVLSTHVSHEQSKSFTFSTSGRTFDIGKITNDDSKRAARRPLRTNQQKEGSRVVFGVPKPTGKKRKFMEVSKHFPANKSNKSCEVNDSVKFTKYLVPQGAASRGWKAPPKNDSKEKRTTESKARVPSTRKTQRTLPLKENFRSILTRDVDNSMDHRADVEDSAGHDNTSEKLIEHGSDASEDASEAPLSSLISHPLSTGSKKVPSSNTKSDRLNRGKIVPSCGKLTKIEEGRAYSANTDKSNLDGSEPRRSNRRIQPTHRLLEGLQSSMVIPKMPSVSHDKGRRNLSARGK